MFAPGCSKFSGKVRSFSFSLLVKFYSVSNLCLLANRTKRKAKGKDYDILMEDPGIGALVLRDKKSLKSKKSAWDL